MNGAYTSPAVPLPTVRRWRHTPPEICAAITRTTEAPSHAWRNGDVLVISSAEMAEYQGVVVPHNHVSVSVRENRRATDAEMDMVRADFDMVDAEEDNHQPGSTRNLFLPLHLPRGTTGICDCKTDETVVIEHDGFTWSRKKGTA